MRYTKRTAVLEIIVILASLLILSPFYLLLANAFKGSVEELNTNAFALPQHWTLDSFAAVFSSDQTPTVLGGLLNSVIITGGTLVLLIFIGSIAAYALVRIPGRLSNLSYVIFLVGIILPFQLGMVPAYVAMRTIGLNGSYIGMIILYTGLLMPLSVYLYCGFVRSLPREYEEAAEVDGAKPFAIFARIIFPLLGPATGTVAILVGLIVWNDFFTSLIFLSGSSIATLPVALYGFVGAQSSQWNVVFAGVIVAMIPVLVFYFIAQKRFIQGFSGGLKG